MADKKRTLTGNLLLTVASIVWGFAFVAQKICASYLDPFSVNAARFLVGGLILLPAVWLSDRIRRSDRRLFSRKNRFWVGLNRFEAVGGSICGVLLCVAANLQQFSISETSPGKTAFLTALYCAFVPVIGLCLGRRVGIHVWGGVGLAMTGAYFLTVYGENTTLALSDLVLLLCAVFFAVHITIVDRVSDRADGIRFSMVQFFVAGALSIPLALFFGGGSSNLWLPALPSVLFLGLLSCGVGYTFQIVGQQLSGRPTVAAIILSLESVFGLIAGLLFGMEGEMTPVKLLGCALILAAVILAQLPNDLFAFKKNKNA